MPLNWSWDCSAIMTNSTHTLAASPPFPTYEQPCGKTPKTQKRERLTAFPLL